MDISKKSNGTQLPLIVIVGPTASGKTAMAVDLAEKFGGEIICADSRTIYKHMDVGTAKPSDSDRRRVLHWGLDLIEPGEKFSAADFKKYANEKIVEIRNRGHVPFLVGGTGLYIDSVIFDFQFGDKSDDEKRQKLNGMTIEQLHDYCDENNIVLPENKLNKRYVIREIERNGNALKRCEKPSHDAIIVGITTDKAILRTRIIARIEQLFKDNVVNEARILAEKFGWDGEAMTGNVYRLSKLLVDGEISESEMKSKLATLDWRLAKRQMTWFKRNPYIKWGTGDEIFAYLSDLLVKCK